MNRGPTHIIGCGDIGRRIAILYLDAARAVEAWVKSETSCRACQHIGLKTHRVDFDRPFKIIGIHDSSQILYAVPPPPKGRKDTRLTAFLNTIESRNISKFVLISTTGVYGDCDGAMVDETTPVNPRADRALRRVDAESKLQKWANENDVDYLILRVPGIYAPDRLPLKRLEAGTPVVIRNQAPWTNRIHADDLASVCFAALNSDVTDEIINVADDTPGTMSEYFFAVADYAGLPRPPEISMREAKQCLSAGMLSYMVESRRISNAKMKSLLGVKLRYPTLKHGLSPGHKF
jgi:dTDP-4-dehydrorhamnose reductase